MAKFLSSNLVGPITGSLGSLTFKQTRYGPVIARRLRRVRKSSDALNASRARHIALIRAWSTLSSTQRQAWNAFAFNIARRDRLNIPRPPTGPALFYSHNTPAQILGLPQISDPPFYTSLPPIENAALDFELPVWYRFNFDLEAPFDPVYLIVHAWQSARPPQFATRPPGRHAPQWFFHRWRLLHIYSTPLAQHTQNLIPFWTPILGPPRVTQAIAVKAQTWHPDALASPDLLVTGFAALL